MNKENLELLFSSKEIESTVEKLGKKISENYKGKKLLVICVLDGAFIFFSDLVRHLSLDISIDFIKVSSYKDETTNSEIELIHSISSTIYNKNVIIVDEIADSGLTLEFLKNHLNKFNPSSIQICVLINKMERRKIDIDIEYSGFIIQEGFLVGYGMDYKNSGRNLPEVYIVKN